jgi:molecular chaperone GrpE
MSDSATTELAGELARLRRAVLRQGHSIDSVREQIATALERPAGRLETSAGRHSPSAAQTRAMIDLGAAVDGLRQLATGSVVPDDDDRPGSLREGLELLRIRVDNLQRSFDLRPIATRGRVFDDRFHDARAVRYDPAVPGGSVLEDLLPGYTLGGRVVRPAAVVVNRQSGSEEP